jgi:hypothetical protein
MMASTFTGCFFGDRIGDGEEQWHALRAVGGAVPRVVHIYREELNMGDGAGIDYSDIPALTDGQLAGFRRAPRGWSRLGWIATVDWLKKYDEGYSTRINISSA